jgi:simple sugar transport system permease protein
MNSAANRSVPTAGLRRVLAGWRLERRPDPRRIGVYRVTAVCVGVAIALLVAPLLSTASSGTFYHTAWTGTLGSPLGMANFLAVAAPLIIAGLGASIPLRLGLWNIGIDGQILVGAWFATGLSYLLPDVPGPLLIPLMMLAGMVGGAVWILLPALARVMLGVNEIVTTFLLNFVATAWMTYWVTGPWLDPNSGGGGIRARPVPDQAQLSLINVGGALVHWGVVLAIVLPLLVAGVMRFSRMGYELTITGGSERASFFAGINVRRRQIGVMLVGGALSGLAGTMDMLGTIHQYSDGLTNNRGFDAVVIAVLAGGSAIGVVVMGLLYALLLAGSDAVSVVGVSNELVYGLIGITLMLGALGEAAARLKLVHTRPAAPVAEIDALETVVA